MIPFLKIPLVWIMTIAAISTSAQNPKDVFAHAHKQQDFRPNQGQWEDDFSHVIYLPRYAAFLTPSGLAFGMNPIEDLKNYHDDFLVTAGTDADLTISSFGFNRTYTGCNTAASIQHVKESNLIRNYFLGNDPDKWVSSLRDAAEVIKKDVYPGIDIHYKTSKKGFLEFDYILAPGADHTSIRWYYEGVDPKIENNEIVFTTPYGTVRERIPSAYQEINGRKVEVQVSYVSDGKYFSFEPGDYNPEYTLVIDPEIVAATLTGTMGSDNYGHGATYDEAGNIFSFGRSFGPGLPTSPGVVQPAFAGTWTENAAINKFNPDGTQQIFATYLGGSNNQTLPHSAVTNIFGDVFIFGSTLANNFPVTAGAAQTNFGGDVDIFISRISPDGTTLIGSTYLGGSGNDGRNQLAFGYDTFRGEVSLDAEGNVYVASASGSSNFPVSSGAYSNALNGPSDALVAKLDGSLGSLAWATFLGGTGHDMAYGVRVADNGNVVVSGGTAGNNFPASPDAVQPSAQNTTSANGYAAVFNLQGSQLLHATYLATEGVDHVFFVDLDNSDDIWVYGSTTDGENWPVTEGVFATLEKSLFITSLNPELSEIIVSTCIGQEVEPSWPGSLAGNPVAFLVDRCDRVYISMHGAMPDMPLSSDALFTSGGFYIAAFTDNLTELGFSTYYSENHVDGGTSRFDKKGIIYQGVCSGGGFNTNPDAYATNQTGGWDIGVFKIDFDLTGVNAAIGAPSELDGCAPHTIQFENYSTGDTFQWDFGDGSPVSSEFNPAHEYDSPGSYTITMIVSDSLSCNLADTVNINIDIFSPTDFTPSFEMQVNCSTGTVSMINTTGGQSFLNFTWIVDDQPLYNSYHATHQFVDVNGDHVIGLQAIDEGCNIDEIVSIDVSDFMDVSAVIGGVEPSICGLSVPFQNESVNATSYVWNFGDGTTSFDINPTHVYADYGTYTITLEALNPSSCNETDVFTTNINFVEPPVISTSIELQQTGECSEMNLSGHLVNLNNIANVTWLYQNQEIAGGEDFSIGVSAPGLQTVLAILEPIGCPNMTIILSQDAEIIRELPVHFGNDFSICYHTQSLDISPDVVLPQSTYLWQPNGETTPAITVNAPGIYGVSIASETCTESRSFDVGYVARARTDFELSICDGRQHLLYVPVSSREFFWEHGEAENPIYIHTTGTYQYAYVDENGCDQDGEVNVVATDLDPLVFIPNAFTPNGDGINDIFKVSSAELDIYKLEIYDRWGGLIFETEDGSQGWNGGELGGEHYVQPGIYSYVVTYSGICVTDVIRKFGAVTLIR